MKRVHVRTYRYACHRNNILVSSVHAAQKASNRVTVRQRETTKGKHAAFFNLLFECSDHHELRNLSIPSTVERVEASFPNFRVALLNVRGAEPGQNQPTENSVFFLRGSFVEGNTRRLAINLSMAAVRLFTKTSRHASEGRSLSLRAFIKTLSVSYDAELPSKKRKKKDTAMGERKKRGGKEIFPPFAISIRSIALRAI